MKKQKSSLTRSEFLRMISLSGLSLLVSPFSGFSHSGKNEISGNPDDFIEKLFVESLIIDGVVNLGMKRGKSSSPLVPGQIKKLTGINVGGHTTRISTLNRRNRWVEQRSEALMRVDRASDIEKARKINRYGIIYFVQSGFDLKGSVEPLAQLKEGGIRIFQITYSDNELGGGSGSDNIPLTPLGRKVVKELNRLRMVVDISHCGKQTTLDVADVSSHPVTANHANVERLCRNKRNKSDEELKAIAATGGVVGVTPINRYLLQDSSRPATIDDFVAHIDYMVEKIGIDHVGVASDGYMDGTERYDVDFSDKYINSPERWKHVARKLHKMGYSKVDLQKIFGLNFKRIYDQVLDP